MELFFILLGLGIIYVLIHGFILNFTEGKFTERTGYSKLLTITQFVVVILMLLAMMS